MILMGRIQRFRGKLLECRLKLFKINKYEFILPVSLTIGLFSLDMSWQKIKEVLPWKVAIR